MYFVFLLTCVFDKKTNGSITNWVIFCAFLPTFIYNITEGLGYPIESFFGKAYIVINHEKISLKSGVFDKEQFVNWNEIKTINYNMIQCDFKIEKTDNTIQFINISKFDYALMVEIKKAISNIAKEKNIQINI